MAIPTKFEKYPNVSTYINGSGQLRYRFGVAGKINRTLVSEIDSPEFIKSYNECTAEVEFLPVKPKTHDNGTTVESFRDALPTGADQGLAGP